MNALILAAGTGSRLVNLTRDLPKALVEVRGRPLMDYTLEFVEALNCEKITIVGGFYYDKLVSFVQRCPGNIELLENANFLKGSILTLQKGLANIDQSFLLLNVDHIYPLRLAKAFLAHKDRFARVTAFVDFDRYLREDDMKILLTEDKRVKKVSKGLHEFDAGYIGLTYVPRHKLAIYKQAVQQVATENEHAVVENILQWLINHDEAPEIFDVSGVRWLEIDNQWDLENAQRILTWMADFLN